MIFFIWGGDDYHPPPPPYPTKGLIGLILLLFFFLALEISKALNIFNQRIAIPLRVQKILLSHFQFDFIWFLMEIWTKLVTVLNINVTFEHFFEFSLNFIQLKFAL